MTTEHEILVKAGIEPILAKIYLLLAQKGELSVSEIIKNSKFSRTSVHEALTVLHKKDFVESRKQDRNVYYKAAHPTKLFDALSEKKRTEQLFEEEFGQAVMHLTGEYNLVNKKPGVRFFEGIDGVKKLYEETLKHKNGKMYVFGTFPEEFDSELDTWITRAYGPKRRKANMFAYIILPLSEESRAYQQTDSAGMRKTVLIPRSALPLDAQVMLFGTSSVIFANLHSGKLMGSLLDNPEIYNTMKAIFVYCWNNVRDGQANKLF